MNKYQTLVREFQLAAKVLDPLPTCPTRLAERHVTLWHWLISEELEEWQRAADIVARSHEQADLLYVLYGSLIWQGLIAPDYVLYAPYIQHGIKADDIPAAVGMYFQALEYGTLGDILLRAIPAIGLLHTNPPEGVKLWPVFCEVHRANMAKMEGGVIRSEGGKILKPDGWQPANVKQVLQAQGIAC